MRSSSACMRSGSHCFCVGSPEDDGEGGVGHDQLRRHAYCTTDRSRPRLSIRSAGWGRAWSPSSAWLPATASRRRESCGRPRCRRKPRPIRRDMPAVRPIGRPMLPQEYACDAPDGMDDAGSLHRSEPGGNFAHPIPLSASRGSLRSAFGPQACNGRPGPRRAKARDHCAKKKRAAARCEPPPAEKGPMKKAYFRFASVRSDDSLTTKVWLHQLEPMPPGLMAVTKVAGPAAV